LLPSANLPISEYDKIEARKHTPRLDGFETEGMDSIAKLIVQVQIITAIRRIQAD
jgi:hypothetical protein